MREFEVNGMRKKWIAVVSSPRKGRNTDRITDYIIEGLNEKGIEVEKYYLDSRNITTCSGCEYCLTAGRCHIQDDVTTIIERMREVDGFILASPSYNYNITAQMKALFDRTFYLNDFSGESWKSRLAPGKKAIVVGVCAGKTEACMGYTLEGLSRPIAELEVGIVDTITYYDTKHLPVEENLGIREEILERIRNNSEI